VDELITNQLCQNIFLHAKNGIIEMAIGTDKARTALKIMSQLLREERLTVSIITMHGNDLLHKLHDNKIACHNS